MLIGLGERMGRIWHNLWVGLGYGDKKSMNIHKFIADLSSSRVSITSRATRRYRPKITRWSSFTLGKELNNSSIYPLCPVRPPVAWREFVGWSSISSRHSVSVFLSISGTTLREMRGQVRVWLDLLTFTLDSDLKWQGFAAALFFFFLFNCWLTDWHPRSFVAVGCHVRRYFPREAQEQSASCSQPSTGQTMKWRRFQRVIYGQKHMMTNNKFYVLNIEYDSALKDRSSYCARVKRTFEGSLAADTIAQPRVWMNTQEILPFNLFMDIVFTFREWMNDKVSRWTRCWKWNKHSVLSWS